MLSPRLTRWISTTAGFGLIPAISMLSPLLALPILVRVGGASGWAAIAIGQGLGATAALVSTFGWGVVGPAEVARASTDERGRIYWISSVMRSLLLAVVLPVTAVIAGLLAEDEYAEVAALACVGIGLQGLAPTWFLVGQARPWTLAAMEAVPRTIGVLLGALGATVSGSVMTYVSITLVAEIGIALTAFLRLARRPASRRVAMRELPHRLRQQWPLALSAALSAGYTRLATPIVSTVSYNSVATFAALDRVSMLARSGLRPLTNTFQGWVARADRSFRQRALWATAVTTAGGLLGGALLAAVLPVADQWLFGDVIRITMLQALLLGAAVTAVAGSSCTALFILVPAGRISAISRSTVCASIGGVPLIYVGADRWSATGAMAAIAAAELFVLGWQGTVALRVLSMDGSATDDAGVAEADRAGSPTSA